MLTKDGYGLKHLSILDYMDVDRGKLLKSIRLVLGKTLLDVSEGSGVSSVTIATAEKSTSATRRFTTIIKLLQYYDKHPRITMIESGFCLDIEKLQKFCLDMGGYIGWTELGKLIGVERSNIRKFAIGRHKTMRPEHISAIFPFIKNMNLTICK